MGRSVTTKIVSTVAGRTGDVSLAITDVNGAAPLESPTLTGIPKAPTAAAGTSTTQIATTEFVSNIAMGAGSVSITNAAPAAETVGASSALGSSSAAARSDHVHAMPSTATSTASGFMSATDKSKLDGVEAGAQVNDVTSVAGRTGAVVITVADVSGAAPLASPALTGTPTAPTATKGTVTTQVATTMFVKTEIEASLATTLPSAETVGADATVGNSSTFARSDHVHAMPDVASTAAAGFMSAADKTKLNGVATGAAALGTSVGTGLGTAAAGSATTAAKSDHVHPLPSLSALGAAAAAHSHDLSSASVMYANSAGRAHPIRQDGVNINFNWTSKTGQPQWVWGANDGQDEANYYVYNPSGFSVDTARNLRPGANQGVVWDNDAFGGGGDAASITLVSNNPGGNESQKEAIRMRFTVANDAEDFFEFVSGAENNNGMTLNGNVVLNAANFNTYAAPASHGHDLSAASVNYANSAGQVAWTGVTGAPSTYAPSAHAHDYAANASPVFTGNPTSPTPNQFDKDTSIATTAFVQRALGNLQGSMVLNAPHSLTWADCGKLVLLGQTQQVSGTIFLPGIIVTDGSAESEDGRTFYIYNASNNSDYKLDCGDIWLHGSPYVWITHTETIKPGEYWTITAARGHYYATVTYDGPSLGIRQTWQVFSAFERVSGVTYENTSSSPISVMITCPDTGGDSPSVRVTVNGTVITEYVYDYGGNFGQCTVSFVVPKGAEYKAELLNTIYGFQKWVELR